MKKTIATLILLLTAHGFAQDGLSTIEKRRLLKEAALTEEVTGTFYFKISAEETELVPESDKQVKPGFGFGYRAAYGNHAIDLSAEGYRKEFQDLEGKRANNYSFTFPRANYLFYTAPKQSASLYFGGGLAFGGLDETTVFAEVEESTDEKGTVIPAVAACEKRESFYGIIANGSLGYEFGRKSKGARTFIQIDVNQPTLARSRTEVFSFTPKISLSAGVGF